MDQLKGMASKMGGGSKPASGGNAGAGQDYGDKGMPCLLSVNNIYLHYCWFGHHIYQVQSLTTRMQVSLLLRRRWVTLNPLRPTRKLPTLPEAELRNLLGRSSSPYPSLPSPLLHVALRGYLLTHFAAKTFQTSSPTRHTDE